MCGLWIMDKEKEESQETEQEKEENKAPEEMDKEGFPKDIDFKKFLGCGG